MRIQVVMGKFTKEDRCRICIGRTGLVDPDCKKCGGTGNRMHGERTYTYEADRSLGLKVGDHVLVPPSIVSSEPQIATVVALEGDPRYHGPVKKILTGYES